ncbi:chemotaxis protein CheA [Limibacter armeniacum]|uniref:chemotaxis protein CheA n=1 Tax=Limibacter armeniacum TaxID=466084 RepID=UPI002FE5CE20
MKSKDDELREIFLAEALDQYEELNRLFTVLEKDHADKSSVEAIFRITHTLKANAAAMGFHNIASLSHILEDIFSEIKQENLKLTTKIFNDLFRANDKVGVMLDGIKEGKEIPYKGLLTKLKLILQKGSKEEKKLSPPIKPVDTDTPPTENEKVPELKEPAENTNTAPVGGADSAPQEKTSEQENKEDKIPDPKSESPALPKKTGTTESEKDAQKEVQQQLTFSDFVQVPVGKLDALLNLVGELAIEKDRIIANSSRYESNEYARLYRITSDLQYSVMNVRLVQVNVLFHKFHRIVRDVATLEGKKVNLVLEGTDIEIDRNVLHSISESMIHLVRNSVSHGIESEKERLEKGKAPEGKVTLRARNEKEYVVIDIIDDGKGIDAEVIRQKVIEKGLAGADYVKSLPDLEVIKYIFESGFSSREEVTAVSGRGVGMDVVRKAVDAIGGKISIDTKVGQGSKFSLLLPSSMAVKNALLFVLNGAEFAIPLSFTEAVVSVTRDKIHKVGNGLMTTHLDKTISVLFLNDIFNCECEEELYEANLQHKSIDNLKPEDRLNIVVVSVDDRMVGFVVDKLLQQKEIIEKPLGKPVDHIRFVSGATILGNGNVCLVLDAPDIVDFLTKTRLQLAHNR